jgi:hypothetical protein
MNKINFLLLIVGLLVSIEAVAERLMPSTYYGQPLMNLNEGEIQSCGVRFIGIQTPVNSANIKESIWFPDSSFMLDRTGYGMVKAILSRTSVGDVVKNTSKQSGLPYKSFWLKASGADATKPIKGEALNGDGLNSKIYATSTEEVANLYRAFVNKEPIQIGFKFPDSSNDFALFGTIEMDDKGLGQVKSCMEELIMKMQKDVYKSNKR